MPPRSQKNFEHKSSKLLSPEENLQVFRLQGERCITISTAVVQLFLTAPPQHSQWIKKDTGILCFVRDSQKKNYFFRLFCMKKNCCVWEQEVYLDMEYIDDRNRVHIFEGQDSMVLFNYASTEEAMDMKTTLENKMAVLKKKNEKRRSSRQHRAQNHGVVQEKNHAFVDNNVVLRKIPDPVAKAAKKKRNLTKADIGKPCDFKHVSHVGWNPDSGFDVNTDDAHLSEFFEKAGVSDKQLQDRDTRQFIYDFIDKHKVLSKIKNDSTMPRRAPPVPPPVASSPSPPVPPRANPKAPMRAAPPPPPVPKPPQAPNNVNTSTTDIQSNNAPPPPPLPMDFASSNTMDSYTHTDEMPNKPKISPMVDTNSALLQSIREGTKLKPVEERKMAPQPAVNDARNDLLSEIRKGTTLKPVQEREVKNSIQGKDQGDMDLAGALARALAERSMVLHSEDDDSSNDSNDEDWDD